jgi:hypothetical protein
MRKVRRGVKMERAMCVCFHRFPSPVVQGLEADTLLSVSQDGTAEATDPLDPSFADADSEDEEGEGGRGKDPNAITEEEEDEFNRELAKMMVASNEPRKVEGGGRKPVALDVGIPLIKRSQAVRREEDFEDAAGAGGEGTATSRRGMQFTLLTKKGNKQQVCFLVILLSRFLLSISTDPVVTLVENRPSQWKSLWTRQLR